MNFTTMEALNKEWTAFLQQIPWDGFGNTIARSNRTFDKKRMVWMKSIAKKYDVSLTELEHKYVND